jgi:hypothetical protein
MGSLFYLANIICHILAVHLIHTCRTWLSDLPTLTILGGSFHVCSSDTLNSLSIARQGLLDDRYAKYSFYKM